MEDFSKIGKWWVPGTDDHIFGTLSFTRDAGLVLEGIATAEALENRCELPLILGVTGAGEKVTLVRCFSYGWTNRGVTNCRCRAEVAVLGVHLAQPEQGFQRISIGYTRLREWIALPYFNRESEQLPGRVRFEFNFPAPMVGSIRGGEVTIKHNLSIQGGDNSPLHLTPRAYIEVVSDAELTLWQWYREYVRPLQYFLTLATGQPNGITEFRASIEGQGEHPDAWVEVIMGSAVQGEKAADVRNEYSRDSLFSLYPLGQRWKQVLADWFLFTDVMGPTIDMFFALTYSDFMYLEHQFLTLVQVAESYSLARRKLEPPFTASEYEAKKAEALANLTPELKDWLEPRILPYTPSPSLLVRLEDLVTHTAPVLGRLIPDAHDFATEVRDTRNLLTHKSHKRKIEQHGLSRISAMIFRLRAILRASFLLEIGIATHQAARFYENNLRFHEHR